MNRMKWDENKNNKQMVDGIVFSNSSIEKLFGLKVKVNDN